jgi:ribose 5-phosphate isomerase A
MSGDKKLAAAEAALTYLPDTGVVGLGSGSTAKLFIDLVGQQVRAGRKWVGVPTSDESKRQALALGIPLLSDTGPWQIDVCVDGADEVSAELDLIKGGGGCQTREKVINHASKFNIIIVDDSKLSKQLGEKWPVPVEVLSFGHESTRAHLEQLGKVSLRLRQGSPWITDAGNFIYDVNLGAIANPTAADSALRAIPGVVETGLFVGRAQCVLVASESGVIKLAPKS